MRIRGAAVVSFSSYKVRENWDTGLLATLCLELVSAPFCFEREETTWPHCLQSSPYPNSPTLLMLESHTSPNHTHTVCPLLVNISLHSYLVFVQYLHGFWDHEVSVLLSGVLEEFSRASFKSSFSDLKFIIQFVQIPCSLPTWLMTSTGRIPTSFKVALENKQTKTQKPNSSLEN